MITSLINSTPIPALQEVIHFTDRRHEVLAGNVANIDTPGYKTRDLNVDVFQARLNEAIEAQREGRVSSIYDSEATMHSLTNYGSDDPMRSVRESLNDILYHDESNVSLEKQVTQVSKNQFQRSMAIALMTQQMRQLEMVISERVV
ncbi:MAG: flagellar basal body rod protein FlgB [Pirellulaceae bacterium]|nr:flagellar basal body rod protein FlgB [Pirellulaceae bacterium]